MCQHRSVPRSSRLPLEVLLLLSALFLSCSGAEFKEALEQLLLLFWLMVIAAVLIKVLPVLLVGLGVAMLLKNLRAPSTASRRVGLVVGGLNVAYGTLALVQLLRVAFAPDTVTPGWDLTLPDPNGLWQALVIAVVSFGTGAWGIHLAVPEAQQKS